LPYIGLVIAIAGVSALVSNRVSILRPSIKIAIACLAASFLCANGYATFQRNKVWRTEETLWRDTTVKSPHNGRALMNYGNTLMAKGDLSGALEYFHRAQALVPFYPVLFVNLGVAEGASGQARLAEQHFKKALHLGPGNPDCYSYYGRWLLSQSRAREALPLLRKAVEMAPMDAGARGALNQAAAFDDQAAGSPAEIVALSLRLYREKRYEDAIAACRRALAIRPDYAEAWNNLGAALNQLGRYQEAVSACEQALRYKPDFELARNNLQYARDMIQSSGK
jgi:Flp pilus assembly protein TadD